MGQYAKIYHPKIGSKHGLMTEKSWAIHRRFDHAIVRKRVETISVFCPSQKAWNSNKGFTDE